jgi:putative phosphoribosyl transferase
MNPSKSATGFEKEVLIRADSGELKGILGVLPQPNGVVLFAHGSGSGRLSPRNNFVARFLQNTGIATLLVDLLEESEASDREKVFDIDLLVKRLLTCAHWLRQQPETRGLSLGYFGASTGAAAALQAAAGSPRESRPLSLGEADRTLP